MTYALVFGAAVFELVGQPFEIDDIQYPGNVIDLWSPEDLAAIGVLPIVEPDPPPAGQMIVSTSLAVVDGQPVRSATYGPAPVPAKVHKYWLTKVLEAEGEMDGIEDDLDALAAAGNRAPRREWQSASEVERSNQLLNEFATSKAWSSERVDGWFVQAAAYQAAAEAGA